jgi:hypothetical protein
MIGSLLYLNAEYLFKLVLIETVSDQIITEKRELITDKVKDCVMSKGVYR